LLVVFIVELMMQGHTHTHQLEDVETSSHDWSL